MEAWIWASLIDKGLLKLKLLRRSPREACRTRRWRQQREKLWGRAKSGEDGDVGTGPEAQGGYFSESKGKPGKTLRLWMVNCVRGLAEYWGLGQGWGWVLVIVHWLNSWFSMFQQMVQVEEGRADSGGLDYVDELSRWRWRTGGDNVIKAEMG